MGETFPTGRLSDAAGRRAAGGLVARFDLRAFLADERGATAVEYGIMIGVLSLALVAIFKDAQSVILDTLNSATGKVAAATGQ